MSYSFENDRDFHRLRCFSKLIAHQMKAGYEVTSEPEHFIPNFHHENPNRCKQHRKETEEDSLYVSHTESNFSVFLTLSWLRPKHLHPFQNQTVFRHSFDPTRKKTFFIQYKCIFTSWQYVISSNKGL